MKHFDTNKCLNFFGQDSIAAELDRLQLYVERRTIKVQVVQGDERIIVGWLEKSTHPDRARIQSELYGTVIILYSQIENLIHDLTPDRTPSSHQEGSDS
ncbi:MAG TPA: hypothetical protein VL335_01870 [Candidatus Paceibacterota bacterium]|jgi:hypothetical protein|nr:hypothetical protein [Candidatus Paceibacterota bacterium]